MLVATKLGRVVTYHEGLPPIESQDPLITWPYETRDKLKLYLPYQPATLLKVILLYGCFSNCTNRATHHISNPADANVRECFLVVK